MPAALLATLTAASATAIQAMPFVDLDVRLDPATREFAATALVTPEVAAFRFTLHRSLVPSRATAGDRPLPIVAEGEDRDLRRWRIDLPREAGMLRVKYAGVLPPLDRNLGARDVLQALPPMAAPGGTFLPAGGAWYPEPGTPFSYRVRLALPAGQRGLVPGRRVEETEAKPGGGTRATFEFPHPAEGIDLMAGPWIVRERSLARPDGGVLALRTYFHPELDATPGLAEGYLDDVARYLDRYEREIGRYAFGEFSVASSPLPVGLGMPTLTYLGTDVLKLPFIRATSLGHEVLHNWWGNGVYADYAQGNWSEGLTTFMADYAYKEAESPQAAYAMRQAWLRDFAAVPPGSRRALASFRSRTHGAEAAVGYGKSAMVFAMLRDAIGADVFARGIRTFWATQRFRTASWDDLRAAFEKASGTSLAAFFAQWVGRADGPELWITGAHARAAGDTVTLELAFAQAAPAYALDVPVAIRYADRTETRRVPIRGERELVRLSVAASPLGVRLDPDLRVWRLLGSEELPPILRQWIVARSPRLVQASADATVRNAAMALARRLFEVTPQEIPPADLVRLREPVLLAGTHAEIDAMLAKAGLPPRPSSLAGRGTAQVWTLAAPGRAPLAVMSATDAAALDAMQRALPHYGSQSWLVFEGGRVLDRGVWPAAAREVTVETSR